MLNKGEKIYFDQFYYELLEKADKKEKMGDILYTAKVKKCYRMEEGISEEEIRFIKFVLAANSTLKKYLEKESSFCMYYPYIERVYGAAVGYTEEEQELFVLEAEFLQGENLHDIFLPNYMEQDCCEDRIFSYFLQMLYAANYYSKCGYGQDRYLHRDIKPDNIMIVDKNGEKQAVLVDFDWAHIVDSRATGEMINQRSGRVGGTKGYIDPRAWGPFQSDIQMDIYSMGRTFCYCLLSEDWRLFSSGEYYTQDENERIYEKMHSLFFRKLPDEDDESFYTKDWMKLAYGLDMKRLDKKYSQRKYEPLIQIIKTMIAPVWGRYGDFETILNKMKKFLEGFYGKEKFREMAMCDLVLEKTEDRKTENSLDFFHYYEKGDGIRNTGAYNDYAVLNNYDIKDIWLCGKIIVTLYNRNGRLNYIAFGEEVKTSSGKDHGEVVSGDIFFYKEYSVKIVINE